MVYFGLDLGKIGDPAAFVGVERIEHRRAFMRTALDRIQVRYAERVPLGTPYPKIVERVKEIVTCNEFHGRCTLTVDATGLGAPVVDMLRAARLGCELTPVVITGGERGAGNGNVPKRNLMAGVQMLLESGQLKVGKLRDGPQLMRELMDIRMSVGGSGHVRIGAERAGQHDDLVIALALACWRANGRTAGEIGEVGHRLLSF